MEVEEKRFLTVKHPPTARYEGKRKQNRAGRRKITSRWMKGGGHRRAGVSVS